MAEAERRIQDHNAMALSCGALPASQVIAAAIACLKPGTHLLAPPFFPVSESDDSDDESESLDESESEDPSEEDSSLVSSSDEVTSSSLSSSLSLPRPQNLDACTVANINQSIGDVENS